MKNLMHKLQKMFGTLGLIRYPKTLPQTSQSKDVSGYTMQDFHRVCGQDMASVIANLQRGLYYLCSTTGTLSGSNNVVSFKVRSLSTYNLAQPREVHCSRVVGIRTLHNELSLLKTYCQQYELGSIQHPPVSWGQSYLQDRQASYLNLASVLLGLTATEQDAWAVSLYEQVWECLLQHQT